MISFRNSLCCVSNQSSSPQKGIVIVKKLDFDKEEIIWTRRT